MSFPSQSSPLDPEFLRAAEELFYLVVPLPSLQRDQFLRDRCTNHPKLYSFVSRLLVNYECSVSLTSQQDPSTPLHEADPLWEVGRLVGGRYRVIRAIGSGGMGQVYEANDEQLPRKIALKVLRARGPVGHAKYKSFELEAHALSRVRHDHIASIIDLISEDGQRVLVLEYVNGGTVRDLLKSGRLTMGEVLKFAGQLFEALAAAHGKGVIHGDLKPDNLGISEYGSLKVLDFGLSILVHEQLGGTKDSKDEAPVFAGTPSYMSPELFFGEPPSVATDLFSTGVLLYEMLKGALPQDESGLPHNFILAKPPVSIRQSRPDVPVQFDSLLTDLLRHDPEERPRSASEALARIKNLVPGSPAPAPLGQSRFRAVPVAAIAVTLAALFLFASRPTPSDERSPASQSYVAGMFAYNNRDFETARACFRDAVGYDSTFALAYFQWSHAEAFWDEAEEARRLAEKAYSYSDKLSEHERGLVQSWYFCITGQTDNALHVLGDRLSANSHDIDALYQTGRIHFRQLNAPRKAIQYYEQVLRLDRNYALAYNDMAYCFLNSGCPDSALWAARQYIVLQPLEANPYDTMGDIMSSLFPDSAAAYFHEALKRKSDFVVPLEKLQRIALRHGLFDEVETFETRMLTSDDTIYRAKGRLYKAQTFMARGQFRKALEELETGIDADVHDHAPKLSTASKRVARAYVLAYMNRLDEALLELDTVATVPSCLGVGLKDIWRLERVRLLVEAGRLEEALGPANDLMKQPGVPEHWNYLAPAAEGLIALGQGDNAHAASSFDAALKIDHRGSLLLSYFYAEALARSGRLQEAEHEFERTIQSSTFATADDPVILVRAYFRLGQVSDRLGHVAKAEEAYRGLRRFWSDADDGVKGIFNVEQTATFKMAA